MNLILEKTDQVTYFTNMRLVFEAMGISPGEFDWYISDIEVNRHPEGFSDEDQWMDGPVLDQLLKRVEVQFIWAVFSAVPRSFRSVVTSSPYSEGNPTFWNGEPVKPQLPGALFEIVSWDSSATLLIGIPEDAGQRFAQSYSDTRPLAEAAR
ncbi:hypothetical protein J2W49_002332 [Hydrogenophaga palleronii]|uniref:Integron gene cassette protein n=1 Tax=Hydrogenophaga palleronii TaxID=65655 RepID=A0ABU1WMF2_9BURK|nr:hypothetical protein [Hydrogenophaga palleronii]MDR7150374.1 hypothetical protein [Hydrogenophaga palleronii]